MTRCRLAPGLLVGLVAAFAIGQPACGAVMKTFYVSPAGDDANPGTQERPLATIGGARDAVRGVNRNMTGDIVVILAGGTYSIAEPIEGMTYLSQPQNTHQGIHCSGLHRLPEPSCFMW